MQYGNRFQTPSWKNTDARGWCFDPFEVCKCYMPPDGYCGKTSMKDIDFNGLLAVIINNKRFQLKMTSNLSVEPNVCTEARVVGREIRHTANHLLSDQDLRKYIGDLINLLSDSAYLATDAKAMNAVNTLKQLKNNTLTIHADDITNVLNDTMESSLRDKLVTLGFEQTKIVNTVLKLFEENKTDSVEAICKIVDQKIYDIEDIRTKGIDELKAETVKGKQVLLDCKQEVFEDVLLYTRTMSHLKYEGVQELQAEIEKGKQQLDVHVKRVLNEVKAVVDESQVDEESKHRMKIGQKKTEKKTIWKRILSRFTSFDEDRDVEDYTEPRLPDVDMEQSRSTLGRAEKLLRLDLINFYQEKYSKTSVSPLVEDVVVPLEELYVRPPMTAVDIRRTLGHPTRTSLTSLQELFIKDDGRMYKNIYVTGDAGIGKTCFSKYICMHWCQAHKVLTSLIKNFKPEDIAATKRFEFLFLITLRDIDASFCDIDELIVAALKDNLRNPPYDRKLIDKIFAERSCLIILEGVDEWLHPSSCKRPHKVDDIPHKKARNNWTTLTTLRPWKFDVIRSSDIDRHVEINILDETSTNQLATNAMNLLNKKSVGKSKKTVEEFNRTISLIKLGEVQHVPFIYLHCVCFWFDGRNIGETKCEIFTNVVELTLNRGTMKIQSGSAPASLRAGREFSFPNCMLGKPYCMRNLALLLKLSKLAFLELFDVENIQRQVLDVIAGRKYLKRKELGYCLKLGLLSQNKVYGPVSQRLSNVGFQNRSFLEFFAALYIQANLKSTNSDRTYVQEIVLKKCKSLSSILEISNVLIFLSGFKPQAYREITHKIKDNVSSDKITCNYRTKTNTFPGDSEYDKLLKHQTLQVECTCEMRIREDACEPLLLEDILIDEKANCKEYMSALQTIIRDNHGSLKSLSIQQCPTTAEVTQILETLDLHNIHSLDKLLLWVVARQPDLEQLLTQSMNTLRCLSLRYVNFKQGIYNLEMTVLSERCEETILNMPLLHAVRLTSLSLTHNQLYKVTTFFTSRVTMTEIRMTNIVCSDHKVCRGVVLDMSRNVNLQCLGLHSVPVSQLQVNVEQLQECVIGELYSSVATDWFKSLKAAQNLKKLWLAGLDDVNLTNIINIITALPRLEQLHIEFTDLGDRLISLSTEMAKLEYISLYEVSMACSILRELVKTVNKLEQSVTVLLLACTLTTESDYETVIREHMKSETFTVIQDGLDEYKRQIFKFQTIK